MAHLFHNRKSRVNPVEVFVFLLVLGIFTHSGYRLLFDWKGIHDAHRSTQGDSFVYYKDGQPAFPKDRAPASVAPEAPPAPAVEPVDPTSKVK